MNVIATPAAVSASEGGITFETAVIILLLLSGTSGIGKNQIALTNILKYTETRSLHNTWAEARCHDSVRDSRVIEAMLRLHCHQHRPIVSSA